MTYLHKAAGLSEDRLYRYWLQRTLSTGTGTVLFIGLNPSTADAQADDPTIRKAVGFAARWGFQDVWMGNLHAFRATDPKVLPRARDAVGPMNREWLECLANAATLVIAAWGATPLADYPKTLATWVIAQPTTRCLGQNQDGSPRHILYLPYTTPIREVR